MTNRKIFRNNRAVAGVIEALLMVALVSTVIGMIQVIYIPEVMKQREAEHMDEVSNQFSYMKAMIDIQTLTGMGTDVPLAYVPIITQITLGSRELPYFATVPSFGELSIMKTGSKIDAVPPIMDDHTSYLSGVSFSSIVYHANNMYFPSQSYILEGGGIILDQSIGSSVMRGDPSISVANVGTDNIEMKFYLTNIIDVPGKNYTSGLGGCFITTNYSSFHEYIPDMHNSIFIYSQYLTAWNDSLNRLFRDVSIDPATQVKIVDISINQRDGVNVVKITPITKTITLKLTMVNIYVQVGPGWVI